MKDRIRARKIRVRKRMIAQRGALSAEAVRESSEAIRRRVLALSEVAEARVIHCYVSAKPNEVDTRRLISEALEEGKRIVVPVTKLWQRRLDHSEIEYLDELEPSVFGLLEPKEECRRRIGIGEIDLVIVPGLAFDPRGNRIGFGGGFYDRFLSKVQAPKIALAYSFQVLEKIEAGPHDVRMDKVVTDERVYDCRCGTKKMIDF
ncbi:MAG: 5-formyltetrahydrofolate cyclo-ligase [Candidatus Latescibacteria bacterium]|nr:5-formyltetrahydrofolate cyclo-ligase [Candidatus Latescibacterota bacterium]